MDAGYVTYGWLFFAHRAEPTNEMRIAAQLGEAANLRESGTEVGEEAVRRTSICFHGARLQAEGERLDLILKDAFELGTVTAHERCEESNAFRFWMARAYSRQTSCGASCT